MSEQTKIEDQKEDNRPLMSDDSSPSPIISEENQMTSDDIQPQTINPVTQMEVHHHGHVHEKKKWKEYLFQFFMLFLAVFCGFLAEYHLEHYIEKERAEELAKRAKK